jgi:hypothetical protein
MNPIVGTDDLFRCARWERLGKDIITVAIEDDEYVIISLARGDDELSRDVREYGALSM